MITTGHIFIKAISRSTLWIAVLIVHVGCIIEAQPSKYSSLSASSEAEEADHLIPAASQSALYTTYGKNSLVSQQDRNSRRISNRNSKVTYFSPTLTSSTTSSTLSPTTRTTTAGSTKATTTLSTSTSTEFVETTTSPGEDEDSCFGKLDGYYQNWGSDCSSYYFCAAGYQITYVCPPGQRFNGKKCDEDYKCPIKAGHINPCGNKANGYYAYPGGRNPGKYFYCFQTSKVIELQCEAGKIFLNGKCNTIITREGGGEKVHKTGSSNKYLPGLGGRGEESGEMERKEKVDTCADKSNGFYREGNSDCTRYYYCINGEKTGLHCQSGFVFNGDLCVDAQSYSCKQDE